MADTTTDTPPVATTEVPEVTIGQQVALKALTGVPEASRDYVASELEAREGFSAERIAETKAELSAETMEMKTDGRTDLAEYNVTVFMEVSEELAADPISHYMANRLGADNTVQILTSEDPKQLLTEQGVSKEAVQVYIDEAKSMGVPGAEEMTPDNFSVGQAQDTNKLMYETAMVQEGERLATLETENPEKAVEERNMMQEMMAGFMEKGDMGMALVAMMMMAFVPDAFGQGQEQGAGQQQGELTQAELDELSPPGTITNPETGEITLAESSMTLGGDNNPSHALQSASGQVVDGSGNPILSGASKTEVETVAAKSNGFEGMLAGFVKPEGVSSATHVEDRGGSQQFEVDVAALNAGRGGIG